MCLFRVRKEVDEEDYVAARVHRERRVIRTSSPVRVSRVSVHSHHGGHGHHSHSHSHHNVHHTTTSRIAIPSPSGLAVPAPQPVPVFVAPPPPPPAPPSPPTVHYVHVSPHSSVSSHSHSHSHDDYSYRGSSPRRSHEDYHRVERRSVREYVDREPERYETSYRYLEAPGSPRDEFPRRRSRSRRRSHSRSRSRDVIYVNEGGDRRRSRYDD
ncbi:hypothetical protein K402DRAFT_395662 [Aulographum hederae CBS 113979]|uniref:Uncharacterized protein n=1 Tax=Aulographum hederae CBS 113979 TaxID=1176131 RepID=A0A6G1GUK4_9PEZI|nr:hypothetical protein K402DRAFT_395662 [Aulographum hederae CBS 113979]